MSTASRTPSPSSLSACGVSTSTATGNISSPRSKTSVASSTRSDSDVVVVPEHKPSSSFSIGRLLFRKGSSAKRDSVDSGKDDETGRSPVTSRPGSPNPGREKSPQMSTTRKLAGFASRSIRKSQWRLFKHRTFFGSQRSSMKNKNQLQLPRLTLRHPSIDSSAMPLQLDVDENPMGESGGGGARDDFLQIRRSTQRRWTDSDTQGRLRDSRDSSDFNDSHDTLDVAGTSTHGVADSSSSSHHHHNYSMTAPVSPNVPLSASSSHSEGWKYSSQKLLWKLKPKYAYSHASSTSSSTDSAWKSLDSMTWRSVDGAEVILRGARLENLSEIERSALQLLAAQRLTKMLPGLNLGKPKDPLSALRQKRQKLVKSNRTPTVADVQRRASGTPMPEEKRVFGVSLAMCMMNEKRLDQESRCRSLDDSTVILLNKSKAKPTKSEPEMVGQTMPEDRKWLYPSTQNLYPTSTSNPSSPSPLIGSAPPTCSILPSANLLSAEPVEPQQVTGRFLKKQRPASASFSCSLDANIDDVDPHALQVPKIVENCTQYLMTYGLTQVGLFRVAGNTKRCRQLRNALEKVGGGAVINDNMVENTTSHDVATLLKEYFRDLPQSLLPAEHYSAYIGAAKFNIDERIEAIRLLFALLVSPNLDTLFVLLKFLHEVSCNSQDKHNAAGDLLPGNKMDARNLATIFAPSILRVDHDKLQETLAENESQVTIVETMISNVEEIFKIPKELQCKIYTKLRETEPDRLDKILNHLSKMDSHESHPGALLSPFPATLEEDSPRHHRHCDHSHIGRQSPLARELTTNGKVKVQSQRSGSWPFSLTKTQTSPSRPEAQHFFPDDSQDGQGPSQECTSTSALGTKSASTTPAPGRKAEFNLKAADDSGRDSEFCSDEITFGTVSQPETSRDRVDTLSAACNSGPSSNSSKKTPMMASLQGATTSKSVDARSPSRERVDIRTAARSSAAAARRRLRNVVRAFRFTSMTRSTPDIAQSS
ncbi:hypothetical protein L3Y34_014716 [Caenorhabditis briggsae]|uniref:Rho-GAP domain-containing protein n=1 Tax=Caenorhabditis briggsae TaxID=6238 RepID=A0AAE9DT31_CAEBR|nr:hypothetical protein L3Y34_014716 [Caenorhabditis briggsae]